MMQGCRNDQTISRVFMMLWKQDRPMTDFASNRQGFDATWDKCFDQPRVSFAGKLDAPAPGQHRDLETGDRRNTYPVSRDDGVSNSWRQRPFSQNQPVQPDMRIQQNQRNASQSSGGQAGEMMSPSIFPFPAISACGCLCGSRIDTGSSSGNTITSTRISLNASGRIIVSELP